MCREMFNALLLYEKRVRYRINENRKKNGYSYSSHR